MAHNIPPNRDVIQQDPYAHASRNGQVASTLLFAITAIAMAALYALNPQGFLLQANYPALAILGSVGAAALISFVVNTIIYCVASRKNGEDLKKITSVHRSGPIQDLPGDNFDFPENGSLQATNNATSASHLEPLTSVKRPGAVPLEVEFQNELISHIEAAVEDLTNLVIAFNAAYYRADQKKVEKLDEIRQSMETVKQLVTTQAKEKFQDTWQLVTLGIGSILFNVINDRNLIALRNKTPQEFIQSLPTILMDENQIDETDHPGNRQVLVHIQKIFNTIAGHEELAANPTFNKKLLELQKICIDYSDLDQKWNNTAKIERTAEQKEILLKSGSIYYQKRFELINYLLIATKPIGLDEANAWAHPVLDATIKQSFLNINNLLLTPFLEGFGEKGIFIEHSGKILAATSAPDATSNLIFTFFPPDMPHKTKIQTLIQTLLPILANPIYYATCKPISLNPWAEPHVFYKAFKKLLEDKTMTPPDLDPTTLDGGGYVKAYRAYLNLFTERLNEMKF